MRSMEPPDAVPGTRVTAALAAVTRSLADRPRLNRAVSGTGRLKILHHGGHRVNGGTPTLAVDTRRTAPPTAPPRVEPRKTQARANQRLVPSDVQREAAGRRSRPACDAHACTFPEP